MKRIVLSLQMQIVASFIALLVATGPCAAQNSASGWGGAQWIWDASAAQDNEPRQMRRTFELKAKVLAADLWITVDNQYTAYVNGHKVGEDGEWGTVEKYNVAKLLVVGKNVLAIEVRNQGGPAGAIARLHIETADKKRQFIVSDARIKVRRIAKDINPAWRKADFDDSVWSSAFVLGNASMGPWNIAGSTRAAQSGRTYDTNETVKVNGRLTPQEQIKHFVLPDDFEIELVAADPLVINPITMVMDDQGRIIVSESHTYRYGPNGSPIKPYANPVIRLDPDGKGGFTRTLIADGFADPVMGIAVKGDKLWLTANNYLYTYDLPATVADPTKPLAINKKTIVTDLNKAWNPFGMFVLEWGPDGKLYMSVGNHNINLKGPEGNMTGRGSSGIIVRMEPDGTKMERLVHGLRVPYSFEFDPFGQLWLLSNGEGNPNRFVRVIEGVDYHCYSRGNVDNNWLAGNHPLAPPSEELHRGAHTQLMRYFGAAYPKEYWGSLLLCNWGAHGYGNPNRAINRFVLDENNNVVKREPFVWCKDPHFRPAHIMLDRDGSLLIADWYGRDDESDLTGRIWRVKYVGKDRPVVKHTLDSDQWKNDDYAIEALGSPSHLVREKAMHELAKRPGKTVESLSLHIAKSANPLGAANALWALQHIGTDRAQNGYYSALNNADWKVRRLAATLLHRGKVRLADANPNLEHFLKDKNAAVRISGALLAEQDSARRLALVSMLDRDTASDPQLRYEVAWHLAQLADEKSLAMLLNSGDADISLAGLIAIDIACYENLPSKKVALVALAKAIENPGKLDHQLLLTVAHLNGDASLAPALLKLIARDDVPTATVARAVLVLKARAAGQNPEQARRVVEKAGKRLIEAVEKGLLPIKTPTDQLVIFELLANEGPTPFALAQIQSQLRSNNRDLKQAAHTLARRFGAKAAPLADSLWPSVLSPKTKFADTIEYLSTIARIEAKPTRAHWGKLLEHDDPLIRAEAVRWWRTFKDNAEFVKDFTSQAPQLVKKQSDLQEDIDVVFRHLQGKEPATVDREALTKFTQDALAKMSAKERGKRAAMGLQVFERNACTKCHTTATTTTLLAPSLKGIAAQKLDYIIESIIYPSKVIKTGFESELIELKNGKALSGLVKEDGDFLRVLSLDKEERVAKSDVETRATTRISVMPTDQERTLSRREFVDLIAYLQTLR